MYRGPQRLVFFVGPDMCGKTNIAQALSHATGIPYFKATSEHDAYLSSKVSKRELFLNQLRYADPRVVDLLKQTGQSVVFDRGWPCEYAYSTVMGRETDNKMLWHLDEQWASLDARIVSCYRTSYMGIVDDLDEGIRAGTLHELDSAYVDFAQRTRCKVHRLCVDDEDLEREVAEVCMFIGFGRGAP
jgi:hypothetical protein